MLAYFAAASGDSPSVVLFQYGLAGVVILGLTYAVVALYKDNQKLHTTISELQAARHDDAKETVDKVSAPLSGISQTMTLIYDKLMISKTKG